MCAVPSERRRPAGWTASGSLARTEIRAAEPAAVQPSSRRRYEASSS